MEMRRSGAARRVSDKGIGAGSISEGMMGGSAVLPMREVRRLPVQYWETDLSLPLIKVRLVTSIFLAAI